MALYPFQLVVIELFPVDLFTTNNKLRHSRKMANEEQGEATSLYISFVMSMVIAQPQTIIPPPSNFTLGTMQSDKYRSPGNCQTQTCPSDCQMEKSDSSLQRTRLNCSRVQWQRALHHCILCFALHLVMYGLDAAARPWKPIP